MRSWLFILRDGPWGYRTLTDIAIPRSTIPASGNGRIPPKRCRKVIGFCRKTPAKNWNVEAVSRPEVFEFSPVTFRPVLAKSSLENGYHSLEHGYYSSGNGRNSPGKNPEISGRNTASMFQRFSGVFLQEPARTTRPRPMLFFAFSTWLTTFFDDFQVNECLVHDNLD